MLLSLILACTLGYNHDNEGVSLSFEQTAATHYFYYDKAIESSVRILSFAGEARQPCSQADIVAKFITRPRKIYHDDSLDTWGRASRAPMFSS